MTGSSADPTARFTSRAADYAEARPRYPDSLVQLLTTELALDPDSIIADIGAGTGLSAEPFLRAGFGVVCVEPNAAMRAQAAQLLASYPGFRGAAGSAEDTGLDDDSVDLVLVAQAFHWVDVSRAQREFRRILRPPGRVCIAWNTRRRTGSAFLAGYEALLRRFGTDYEEVDRRTARLTGIDGQGGEELHRFFPHGHAHRVLENRQQLTLDGLVRRIRSSSYMPDAASPAYAAMLAAFQALFAAESRDGTVELRYDLHVYLGRLLAH